MYISIHTSSCSIHYLVIPHIYHINRRNTTRYRIPLHQITPGSQFPWYHFSKYPTRLFPISWVLHGKLLLSLSVCCSIFLSISVPRLIYYVFLTLKLSVCVHLYVCLWIQLLFYFFFLNIFSKWSFYTLSLSLSLFLLLFCQSSLHLTP